MDISKSVFLILGMLVVVFVIGALRNHVEMLINFLLRGSAGMLAIYLINYFLAGAKLQLEMGCNLITFLLSGILGLPGVAMLYGISFYMRM